MTDFLLAVEFDLAGLVRAVVETKRRSYELHLAFYPLPEPKGFVIMFNPQTPVVEVLRAGLKAAADLEAANVGKI